MKVGAFLPVAQIWYQELQLTRLLPFLTSFVSTCLFLGPWPPPQAPLQPRDAGVSSPDHGGAFCSWRKGVRRTTTWPRVGCLPGPLALATLEPLPCPWCGPRPLPSVTFRSREAVTAGPAVLLLVVVSPEQPRKRGQCTLTEAGETVPGTGRSHHGAAARRFIVGSWAFKADTLVATSFPHVLPLY